MVDGKIFFSLDKTSVIAAGVWRREEKKKKKRGEKRWSIETQSLSKSTLWKSIRAL